MRPGECRRSHRRHRVRGGEGCTVTFHFPDPSGHRCEMPLHDLSDAGLSVVLAHELPGLEVGDQLEGAKVSVGTRSFRGDLLVMHVTPAPEAGATFGALFFPESDADLLTLRRVIADLEARQLGVPAEAHR